MKRIFLLLSFAASLFAQDQTKSGRPTTIGTVTIPASATVATALSIYIDYITLVNKTGSTVTVTMVDQSTNCNNGTAACSIIPAVTVNANSVYSIPMQGYYASGGIVWSATAANSVDCWIGGRY